MRTQCDHLHLLEEQGVLQRSYDPHKALISDPGVSLGGLERHREAAKIHKYCCQLVQDVWNNLPAKYLKKLSAGGLTRNGSVL